MIGRLAMAGATLMTLACTTVPPTGPVEEPITVHGGEEGSCDASRAQTLIGRAASSEVGAEAQRLTGGRGIRWIQPGQAVTMDFRADRINIELDARNRVTRITCG